MKKIELFTNKEDCCACGACLNACPKGAISMTRDENGFLYPTIDSESCVECGKCVNTCSFVHHERLNSTDTPMVYVSAAKDKNINKKSASGGIFAELALCVLSKNGVVFGSAWTDDYSAEHIRIDSAEELYRIQGSKYVQSNIGSTYSQAKSALEDGKTVLFSGTPCQISGLRSFLNRDYRSLYTVDIVCHGVPSDSILKDDVRHQLRKKGLPEQGATVSFRSKDKGWGTTGTITSGDKKLPFDAIRSPYYSYFLKGSIYRDSCYNCRYASEPRVGDITLGDYWGVEKNHPDVDSVIKIEDGVSCVIANTAKGKELFSMLSERVSTLESTLEKAKKYNGQLSHCTKKPSNRERLLEIYRVQGYDGILKHWKKTARKERILLRIKSLIPSSLKKLLKRLG